PAPEETIPGRSGTARDLAGCWIGLAGHSSAAPVRSFPSVPARGPPQHPGAGRLGDGDRTPRHLGRWLGVQGRDESRTDPCAPPMRSTDERVGDHETEIEHEADRPDRDRRGNGAARPAWGWLAAGGAQRTAW